MPESIEAVLVSATQHALETTAFLFAEPGSPDDTGSPEEGATEDCASVTATVAFVGSHRGALSIAFPVRLLAVLAANVLGEEEPPDDATQRDALGELANIVCGNVLPALSPDGTYSLGAPDVSSAPAAFVGDVVRVASGGMLVEGAKVETSLWLCGPGSAARPA